jgi:hypothetical protein
VISAAERGDETMMRTTNRLLALAMVGALILPGWQAFGGEDRPVKPVKQWSGSFDDEKDEQLMDQAPKSGLIANEKAWAKLWKAWRGDEKLPRIDFTKELVLVGTTACGRNQLSGHFQLDASGDLHVMWATTLIAGPGFAYHISVVERDEIKSINGKALDK